MDIILMLMLACIALVIGFGLVMAIDLNKLINAEVAAEKAAIRAAFKHARGRNEKA